MSRVFARDAAQKVACDGLRWVTGAAGARAVGGPRCPAAAGSTPRSPRKKG